MRGSACCLPRAAAHMQLCCSEKVIPGSVHEVIEMPEIQIIPNPLESMHFSQKILLSHVTYFPMCLLTAWCLAQRSRNLARVHPFWLFIQAACRSAGRCRELSSGPLPWLFEMGFTSYAAKCACPALESRNHPCK